MDVRTAAPCTKRPSTRFFQGKMEIKIEGLVTANRLRELLALLEATSGISCYFDGSLRLQAQTAQVGALQPDHVRATKGCPDKSLTDDEREPEDDDWDGPYPTYIAGVVDNSPEVLERRRQYELEKKQREEAAALEKRLIDEHRMDKEVFGRLKLRYGPALIDAVNAEIAAVWSEVKPVYAHNCKDGKAGQPRLMPQLELRGDTVSFHGFNLAGTTLRVATPLSIPDSIEGARPVWKFKEWAEFVVPRIKAVIDSYAEKANLVKVGCKTESSA